MEKLSFLSEDGQPIPGLLWLPTPRTGPSRLVLIVDDRGKAAVAESGLVPLLLDVRFAVFAVDLRGRGETLGRIQPRAGVTEMSATSPVRAESLTAAAHP